MDTSRAEAEALFHQHLLQLLHEFEQLREGSFGKWKHIDGALPENDALPTAEMQLEKVGTFSALKEGKTSSRELLFDEIPNEGESFADGLVPEKVEAQEVFQQPSPIAALPPRLRTLYMKMASGETGKIQWHTCQNFLKYCDKKEDFNELEEDVRLLTAQIKIKESKKRASGQFQTDELALNYSEYALVMNGDLSNLSESSQKRLLEFRKRLEDEALTETFLNWKPPPVQRPWWKRLSLEDIPQAFILEFLPAFVVLVNAVVIGVSLDFNQDALHWQVIEWFFTTYFSMEALLRMRIIGCKEYFSAADAGWNYFDLLCLACAYTDIVVTALLQSGSESGLGGIMLIKILRLGRVCRLIRVMRFGAVRELRVIILGVLSGTRVLFWAIVLLFFTVYIVGLMARMIMGEEEELPEFKTTQAAMMTTFRCVTDGCSSVAGAPLHEYLREKYGAGFMLLYMVIFLFVVIGIFNLIMAVFLDSVLSDHHARELQELGYKSQEMEKYIANVIGTLCSGHRIDLDADKPKTLCQSICGCCTRKKSLKKKQVSAIVQRQLNQEVVVARKDFSKWLEYPEMLEMLSFCKIEIATKHDLFDVLDAEMSDELHFNELVDGLMRLRGPITKVDVIALRLKMRHLVRVVQELLERQV